jgi:membrane protease YdiL (CAAX protease family)
MWIKPKPITFDCIWFRWTRSEIIKFPLLILGTLIVGIVIVTLSHFLNLSVNTDFLLWNDDHSKAFWSWILIRTILLSPVFEEVFWRGFIQSAITRIFGAWIGVLGQALLFGLLHIYYPPLGMLNACLLGLVFGIWRHNRKTLLPVIIMHIIRNLVGIIVAWHFYR